VAKTVGLAMLATLIATTLLTGKVMSKLKCDPLSVAEAYVAKKFPSSDSNGLKRVISENGNFWQLTYRLPANMLGGVPIITVDMRTCKVVRAVHTQ
jgi:NTF2 fold immunity protein